MPQSIFKRKPQPSCLIPNFIEPVGANNYLPLHGIMNAKQISFPKRYSSRLDIGCLPDIRCLKNPGSKCVYERKPLALPKDIVCF